MIESTQNVPIYAYTVATKERECYRRDNSLSAVIWVIGQIFEFWRKTAASLKTTK